MTHLDTRVTSGGGYSISPMLGMGPFPIEGNEDADLINAGKQTITELPQTAYFDSAQSFCMIRGGKIAMAILAAVEVAENGDLANWMSDGSGCRCRPRDRGDGSHE